MKTSGLTTMEIKKINKSSIYQHIYNFHTVSKQKIASDLNMGLTTVTQNLKFLESEGLIERKGYFESTGGRKANAIQIVSDFRISLGIEILKDRIHMAAVNLYGETLAQKTFVIPFVSSQEYCRKLGDLLQDFLRQYPHLTEDKDRILGVSIAVQGIISKDGSSVFYGKLLNQTTLTQQDFQEYIPYSCHLEHDSKAAASLEIWHRQEFQDSVVLLLNKNLGSAVIIGGNIHHGSHSHSGTLEHLCVDPQGPPCYCGKTGCLETYCSVESLEHMCGGNLDNFFENVRSGEEEEVNLWNTYLSNLGAAIRNITVMLDVPVILSGYLSAYLTDSDVETLYDFIEDLTPFPGDRNFIHVSTHGSLAPAIGAALHDLDTFLASV